MENKSFQALVLIFETHPQKSSQGTPRGGRQSMGDWQFEEQILKLPISSGLSVSMLLNSGIHPHGSCLGGPGKGGFSIFSGPIFGLRFRKKVLREPGSNQLKKTVENGRSGRPSESTQEALNCLSAHCLGCFGQFSTSSTKIPLGGPT